MCVGYDSQKLYYKDKKKIKHEEERHDLKSALLLVCLFGKWKIIRIHFGADGKLGILS